MTALGPWVRTGPHRAVLPDEDGGVWRVIAWPDGSGTVIIDGATEGMDGTTVYDGMQHVERIARQMGHTIRRPERPKMADAATGTRWVPPVTAAGRLWSWLYGASITGRIHGLSGATQEPEDGWWGQVDEDGNVVLTSEGVEVAWSVLSPGDWADLDGVVELGDYSATIITSELYQRAMEGT